MLLVVALSGILISSAFAHSKSSPVDIYFENNTGFYLAADIIYWMYSNSLINNDAIGSSGELYDIIQNKGFTDNSVSFNTQSATFSNMLNYADSYTEVRPDYANGLVNDL